MPGKNEVVFILGIILGFLILGGSLWISTSHAIPSKNSVKAESIAGKTPASLTMKNLREVSLNTRAERLAYIRQITTMFDDFHRRLEKDLKKVALQESP